MGIDIDREEFSPDDYVRYSARLRENLAALGALLRLPAFGAGPLTTGAELEFFLIDDRGRPLPVNRDVLSAAMDSRVQLELDRFNLEFNSRPAPLGGRPFTELQRQLDQAVTLLNRAALPYGGRVAMIGILPTLREADLQSWALSDVKRFRALSAAMRRLRQAPFQVQIDGVESLRLACNDVTLEGANTSFQVHLRVPPADFAAVYNAAQLAIAPVLAASTNSPVLLERVLWEETRIALYGQASDERAAGLDWRPSRVSFGHGWIREGALELFAETVALHEPLLPIVGSEDSIACVQRGELPHLDELRLHHGTVWRWNRAVYDRECGGHVRIEMRALPAGPTVADMLANAAVLLGLTLGLQPEVTWMMAALPFQYAEQNFYRAAQSGLDAILFWPYPDAPSPRAVRVTDLWSRLFPIVRRGLTAVGVATEEVDCVLTLFASRLGCRMTGARWQRRQLAEFDKLLPRPAALAQMLERYVCHSQAGGPVHTWPVEA